jgi:riboflavin synthase
MFTGIIQAIGHVESLQHQGGDVRLTVDAAGLELNASNLGDSIAVNGVCLTAVEYTANGFAADVSRETLKLTSLGSLKAGSPVNLEKALTLSTPLGGHLVSGHVDGLGVLLEQHDDGRSIRYQFQVPDELARYIAAKGSITIDGTSLTVNQVDGNSFGVNIVPHTWDNTLFKHYQINTQVNIEVDIIARYLERLLAGHDAGDGDKQLLDRLAQAGFVATDH